MHSRPLMYEHEEREEMMDHVQSTIGVTIRQAIAAGYLIVFTLIAAWVLGLLQ